MATVVLEAVRADTGRSAQEVTRRDVALGLLAVPARQALAELPALRGELLAAGRPLSVAFWDSAEQLLGAIAESRATVGEVRRWLEATGTEPIQMAAGGFLWPDEGERGPVCVEMHGALVRHLEDLLAAGRIDPDRLLAGDQAAIADYEQLQVEWLYRPLPDGRQPIWAVSDEEDEEFFALWDAAEADARQILAELLEGTPPRHCPEPQLAAACARLREELRRPGPDGQLLAAIGRLDPAALPTEDRELWLDLATGVVTGGALDPMSDLSDSQDHLSWTMLEHPDWIGAVVSLVRRGPGSDVTADALAHDAATFDFEADETDDAASDDAWDDDEDGWLDDAWLDDPMLDDGDAELQLRLGFSTVERLWRTLAAIDPDSRLTQLGWWGLPLALDRAWTPRDTSG